MLAVTFSTNVTLAGVLSAQSAPAQSIAPAAVTPAVDLSAKALRTMMSARDVSAPAWEHDRVTIPQGGTRIDSKSGGKAASLGLWVTTALFGAIGAAVLVSSSQPGEGCDTTTTTSCSFQRGAGATFLATAAVTGVVGLMKRPGPSGVRTVTGTTSSPRATTIITNRTKHPLEVTMEGPADKKLMIPANSSQTVELEAGQYRLNVRAIGVDAEPYLAMQVYERGIAYKEGFYVRK